MKGRRTKIPGAVIILAGMVTVAYPLIRAARLERGTDELLTQWEQALAAPPQTPDAPHTGSGALDGDIHEEDTDPEYDADYMLRNMAGVIVIEKIGLRLPILRGATKSNLNLGACVLDGSPEMDGEGNYCLAGHRSRTYGRYFNRLGELSPGDAVELCDGDVEYKFTVAQTLLVTPDDTWVLADTADKTELTLITCDYSTTPTGRFVVRCEPAE